MHFGAGDDLQQDGHQVDGDQLNENGARPKQVARGLCLTVNEIAADDDE